MFSCVLFSPGSLTLEISQDSSSRGRCLSLMTSSLRSLISMAFLWSRWGLTDLVFCFLREDVEVGPIEVGSLLSFSKHFQKSDVSVLYQILFLLKVQLLLIISWMSAQNCPIVLYLLALRFSSTVLKSMGFVIISRQWGMPMPMGSTGLRNGQELLFFLSWARIFWQCLSTSSQQRAWCSSQGWSSMSSFMDASSSPSRRILLVFLSMVKVRLGMRLVLMARSTWMLQLGGSSLAIALAWLTVISTLKGRPISLSSQLVASFDFQQQLQL